MKKSRLFAPFLMLLAGAVTSIMMYYFHYSAKEMLPVLLLVLLIFYFAGCFIQNRLSDFVSQIKAQEEEERKKMELEEAMEDEGEFADRAEENTGNEA